MNESDIAKRLSAMISTPSGVDSLFDDDVMRKFMDASRQSSLKRFQEEYATQAREDLKNTKLVSMFTINPLSKSEVADLIQRFDENALDPATVHAGHEVGISGEPAYLPHPPYSDAGASWMAGWLSGRIDYEMAQAEKNKAAYTSAASRREGSKLSVEQMKEFFTQPMYERDLTGEQKIAAGLNQLLKGIS